MRKWHRWLSVFFSMFLFWIAATGLLSQAADLWPYAEPTSAQQATAAPPPGLVCPEEWRCRPPEPDTGFVSFKGWFHHLHSGEEFGPVGVAISILSGMALVFFSFSGVWMYVRMWLSCKDRRANAGWSWK